MSRAHTSQIDGLAVIRFAAEVPDAPRVVIVHGTMDRSSGFRRTARALPELDVTLYDRRGYAGSAEAGLSPTLADQVRDLETVVRAVAGDGPVVVVGHSLGGLVCLHLALERPSLLSAIGVWEPPLPWFDWYAGSVADRARAIASAEDPAMAAELFIRGMITDRLWDRMPSSMKAERRAEGPALIADLDLARDPSATVDFKMLRVPVVAGTGADSSDRFRRSAQLIMAEAPDGLLVEVPGAEHGVHLTHPAEFAAFVRATVASGPPR